MYTMTKTKQARPSLIIQMTVFLSLGASVMSTICTQGGITVNVAFHEESTGPNNTQLLLQSDVDNYTIQLTNVTQGVSVNYPARDYFLIYYESIKKGYYISMIKSIDRDGKSPNTSDDVKMLQYHIICNSTSIFNGFLTIEIHDVNDNSPVFSSLKFTTNISELTDPGLTIYEISSTDLDEGLNKQVSYSLSSSPGAMFDGSKYFTIQGHGSVVVSGYLDFESMYDASRVYYNVTKKMYVTAHSPPSQAYYNVTITARDKGNRTSSTILIINILDGDDQGPGFVYPSCITYSDELKPPTCIRPKYRSSISSDTGQVISLQTTPDPTDVYSPGNPINIIMQDEDTLNSSVICNVSNTIPDGYTHLFLTRSIRIGQTKQYRCDVLYTPDVNTSIGSLGLAEMDVIIKAEETKFYKRSEYASIVVTITGSSSSYCPAGYNTETTNLGVVICTATSEKDASVALALGLGLGITLGITILIIIILIVVVVVMLKRWKPAVDKNPHNYNSVNMTQRDEHGYNGIHSIGTDSETSRYQNYQIGQSDKQTDLSTQSHIYDDLVDGSIIRRDRDVTESSGYANVAADV